MEVVADRHYYRVVFRSEAAAIGFKCCNKLQHKMHYENFPLISADKKYMNCCRSEARCPTGSSVAGRKQEDLPEVVLVKPRLVQPEAVLEVIEPRRI